MPNQYADALNFSGLDPKAALDQWAKTRAAVFAKYGLTPESLNDPATLQRLPQAARDEVVNATSMETLAQQNPEAWKLLKSGYDTGDKTRQIFNQGTGDWQEQEKKGYWSHPESWIQLGAGAGLGAVALPALLGSAAASGSSAAAPVAASAGGVGGTAATVAGVAPVAAKAGGLSSWLTGPTAGLISKGIEAGTGIWGMQKQAAANDEATRLQNEQFDKALAEQKEQKGFDRNQYADYLNRLQGFADTGNAANARLASFSGAPAPANAPVNGQNVRPAPTNQYSEVMAKAQPQAAPQASPQTVKLQGPDGSVKDVPADQADHYLKMGAKPFAA